MKKQIQKETFIKWISVYDQLPESGVEVLALNEKGAIFSTSFTPDYGWQARCGGAIKFWSKYNLPK